MKKISIAIVDNNLFERKETRNMIEDYSRQKCYCFEIKEFVSGREFLDEIARTGPYEIVFMEVAMHGLNGIRVAKEILEKEYRIEIIFLSHDSGNAYQAFRVRASDYLLKPLERETLYLSMDRIIFKIVNSEISTVELKIKGGKMRVPIDNIKYVDVVDRALCFHMNNGEEVRTCCIRDNFKNALYTNIEFGVDMSNFTFAGSSCLINLGYIVRTGDGEVFLKNGEQVQIPRTSMSMVLEAWRKYRL